MNRPTNEARTRAVLELVLEERRAQEERYGEVCTKLMDGSGPRSKWLLPFTSESAYVVQQRLRRDYEEFEEEVGEPTWMHLVREEVAEAFQEDHPEGLSRELIQVAALCVSWVERLPIHTMLNCEECGLRKGPHQFEGRNLCSDCMPEDS